MSDHDRTSAVPGLDVDGLTLWLASTHPELADGRLTASILPGGRSNLTYRVNGARSPLVLRRPPLGHVLASAHDMRREHRVISALYGTTVPVPATVDLVDDTQSGRITGTPFFVMRFVEGRVLNDPAQNRELTSVGILALARELALDLARLHTLDPEAIGLEDIGRANGYLARQLSTWRRQLDSSRSRETPSLDRLLESLGERMPHTTRSSLVHGDYRLDNVIVDGGADDPRIAAILDWEMSTIGDPLVDLGMFGLYWNIAEVPGAAGLIPSAVDRLAGYPGFDELVDSYASETGIPTPELSWYTAFAAFKLAVIAEGIHFRYRAGETVGADFEHIADALEPLAHYAQAALAPGRR